MSLFAVIAALVISLVSAANVAVSTFRSDKVLGDTSQGVPPIGNLDGMQNDTCRIDGWTVDPDTPSTSIQIHVYRDGVAGSGGTFVGVYTANASRPDINQIGYPGNHGFVAVFDTQSGLRDGKDHPLYVYGIDSTNPDRNTLLGYSPRTIRCPAPNQGNVMPIGSFDGVTNESCYISGWTADPDTPSISTPVHVYRDGPTGGGGTFIGEYYANLPRSDINQIGYPGNHGFAITLDASSGLKDGKAHSIYVYGIDSAGGPAKHLDNSPKTATCAATRSSPSPSPSPSPQADRLPIGSFDGVHNNSCYIDGWALDPDTPNTSIAVHVYRDNPAGSGTLIGGYQADIPRADVNSATGYPGNHGFAITFDASSGLKDGKQHVLYVYAINSANNNKNTQLSISRTISCQKVVIDVPDAPFDIECKANWVKVKDLGSVPRNAIASFNNRLVLTTVLPNKDYYLYGEKVIAREINPSSGTDTGWYEIGFNNSQDSMVLINQEGKLNLYLYGNVAPDGKKRTVFMGTYLSEKKWGSFIDTNNANMKRTGPNTAALNGTTYRFNSVYQGNTPSAFLEKCSTSESPPPSASPSASPSGNKLPYDPKITGPATGETDHELEFSFVAQDSDSQSLDYSINWGDSTYTFIYNQPVGVAAVESHVWPEPSEYTVSVFVHDEIFRGSQVSLEVKVNITGTPTVCSDVAINGDSAKKLDITFIPALYGNDQLSTFGSDVNAAISGSSGIRHFKPFSDRSSSINVHRVDRVRKDLDDSIIINGRVIYSTNTDLVRKIAQVCPSDSVIVMVNVGYGGAAYRAANIAFVGARDSWAPVTTTHEFGHSFGGLSDEYVEAGRSPGGGVNCSQSSTDPIWKGTPGTFTGIAGCTSTTWYRPTENSLMRSLITREDAFDPWNIKILTDILKPYE